MSYATEPTPSIPPAADGYDKPLPSITPLTQGFWDNAKHNKLAMQVCASCGDIHFPASPVCPNCLSDEQDWRPVSGRGELVSWVEFHRAYWPGFAADLPYRVCLVKLEEGPLLISNLVGEDAAIGEKLEVVFQPVTQDVTLPKFQRAR